MVTVWMETLFGIEPIRWIYGLAVLISQMLSQTPLAFMIMLGVIQGVSPTLEEASQTLRATLLAHIQDRHLATVTPRYCQYLPAGFCGKSC